MSVIRHHNALAAGYRLHWYRIESVLGQGGFGITYLATDTNLNQPVAIKEFLPSDLAIRTQDSSVHPVSDARSDTFGWGLTRFLTEARTLAQFRHPNIVRVYSVFEANGTAYMVMEYERGTSLEDALKFRYLEGERALVALVHALMDGLELVHQAGFIHRDIKPDNIFMRANDGVPVLLDFGSARQAVGVQAKTLTSLVTPGYAPFEQYNATRDNDRQGPWTDVYSLAATVYRGVTGAGPVDALARADAMLSGKPDPLIPLVTVVPDGFSQALLRAVDAGLAFQPHHRPQSLAEWRDLLPARPTMPAFTAPERTLGTVPAAPPLPTVSPDAATVVRPGAPPPRVPTAPGGVSAPVTPRAAAPAATRPGNAVRNAGIAALALILIAGGGFAAWSLLPVLREAAPPRDDTVARAPHATPSPPPASPAPVLQPARVAPAPARAGEGTAAPVDEGKRLEAERVAQRQGRQVAEDRAAAGARAAEEARAAREAAEARAAEEARAAQAVAEAHAAAEARVAREAAEARAAEEARAAQAAAEARAAEEARAAQAAAEARAAEEARVAREAAEARAAEEARAAQAAAEARAVKAAEEKAAAQAQAAAAAAPLSAPGAPMQGGGREAERSALLEAAAADVAALRLTSPQGRNAFERYRAVLDMDPGNAEARAGLERIVTRYLALAEEAAGKGDLPRGADMLDHAARVDPGDPRIAAARATLAGQRRAAGAREAEARRIAAQTAERQAREEAAAKAPAATQAGTGSPTEDPVGRTVKLAVFPHDSVRPCFHPVGGRLHDAAKRTAAGLGSVELTYSSHAGAPLAAPAGDLWQGAAERKTPRIAAVQAAARTVGADAVLMAWYDCQSEPGVNESSYRADVYLVDVRTGKVYFASRGAPDTLKAARTVLEALYASRGL